MKRSFFLFLFVLAVLILTTASPVPAACTVCHSKNPKMVRMHEALGYKDCFVCHGPTAKKSTEDPKERMTSDALCIRCHARSNAESPGLK